MLAASPHEWGTRLLFRVVILKAIFGFRLAISSQSSVPGSGAIRIANKVQRSFAMLRMTDVKWTLLN
jgi:hypothetical protein